MKLDHYIEAKKTKLSFGYIFSFLVKAAVLYIVLMAVYEQFLK